MEKKSKIRKFEKIINENETAMLQIIVLYNMSCFDTYKDLTDEQKEKLLGIIYNFYLKDETFTDMGHISDIVMENYKEILSLLDLREFDGIRSLISENL